MVTHWNRELGRTVMRVCKYKRKKLRLQGVGVMVYTLHPRGLMSWEGHR